MATPHFESVSPVYFVSDVQRALAFYRDQLGFHVAFTWPSPPESASYAGICRGEVTIHLSHCEDESRCGGASAYVFVKNIDDYAHELGERGVDFLNPLKSTDYGMREFDLKDPDGNYLCFGEASSPAQAGSA